jgi:hypothetical protein
MANQQYKNHTRYYIPHHFVFYPVITILFAICIKNYLTPQPVNDLWLIMAALVFMIGALSFMLRQHYALNNQDRIVRLEMRLRYYQLTQQGFDPIEKKLSFNQLAALRFAGDDELLLLIDKTIAENLPPDAIKKLVKDWQEDDMRV